jgi:hypothetical protein
VLGCVNWQYGTNQQTNKPLVLVLGCVNWQYGTNQQTNKPLVLVLSLKEECQENGFSSKAFWSGPKEDKRKT